MGDTRLSRNIESVISARWSDDEASVVFDPKSGETLKLNLVERTAFQCLGSIGVPLPLDEWMERVARELQTPLDDQIQSYLIGFAEQLEQLGFVNCDRT